MTTVTRGVGGKKGSFSLVKLFTRQERPYVNPYLGGVLLGVVLFLAFFLTGNGLGASGGLNRLTVLVEDIIVPEHVDRTPYLLAMAGGNRNPLDNWVVPVVFGTIAGGFISGLLNGRLKPGTGKGPRISVRMRWVLAFAGFNLSTLLGEAMATTAADGSEVNLLAPMERYKDPLALISMGLALVLGASGLPHVLMRFYTVPTAKEARRSVTWAIGLIGAFYLFTMVLGYGAAWLVGPKAISEMPGGANAAAPALAYELGGQGIPLSLVGQRRNDRTDPEIQRNLEARGASGQIVLVGEAVLAGNVPDITASLRKEVYTKVRMPQPAALGANDVMGAMRSAMAYWHLASASWCWAVRKRNRGSGLMEKGRSFRPKWAVYMDDGASSGNISRIGVTCTLSSRVRFVKSQFSWRRPWRQGIAEERWTALRQGGQEPKVGLGRPHSLSRRHRHRPAVGRPEVQPE